MNCYVCDLQGRQVPAVATCANCSVALCRHCLHFDLLAPRSVGMHRRGCTHQPVHDARLALAAGKVSEPHIEATSSGTLTPQP